MRLIFIRKGYGTVPYELRQRPIRLGDVLILAADAEYDSNAAGGLTATTICLDTNYWLDQVRWRYAEFLGNRSEARQFAESLCSESFRLIRVGEGRVATLTPLLDELVWLSAKRSFARDYLRIHVLLFQIAQAIDPFIDARAACALQSEWAPSGPAHQERYLSQRSSEAHRAGNSLLREFPARRWTLNSLCAEVHLSRSSLISVFLQSYGETPLVYLRAVRAELLAKLLREIDLTVAAGDC